MLLEPKDFLRVVSLDEDEATLPMIVVGYEVRNDRGAWRGDPLDDLLSGAPKLATLETNPLIRAFEHAVGRRDSTDKGARYTHLVGVALRLALNLGAVNDGAEHFVESLRTPNSGHPEGRFLYAWAEREDTPIPESELRDFEAVLSSTFRAFPPLLRGVSNLLESVPLTADDALRYFGGWAVSRFVPETDTQFHAAWRTTEGGHFDRLLFDEVEAIASFVVTDGTKLPHAFLVW